VIVNDMPTIITKRPGTAKAVELVEKGLPWPNIQALAAALELPLDRLATLLDVPAATFYRRKRAGRLSRPRAHISAAGMLTCACVESTARYVPSIQSPKI